MNFVRGENVKKNTKELELAILIIILVILLDTLYLLKVINIVYFAYFMASLMIVSLLGTIFTYIDERKRKEKKKPKARSWKEQNYISNAKMMLMQRNHLSEDEAYRYIQKSSMDSGTNMVETAQMLLMLLYDE